MSITLLVTCDDAGMSAGVDKAILDLHSAGIASTTSVLCNMSHIAESLKLFAKNPTLECGVHLNLTEGEAITRAIRDTSLVRTNGHFKGRLAVFRNALFLSSQDKVAIHSELNAQIQRFADSGLRLTHITTHHHFHMLPVYRNMIYELAQQFDVPWVRNHRLRCAVLPQNFLLKVKEPLRKSTITSPDYVVLIQAWVKQPPAQLLSKLLTLNGLIEIVVHPALPIDESFPSSMMYTPVERYQEVRYINQLFELAKPFLGRQIHLFDSIEAYYG